MFSYGHRRLAAGHAGLLFQKWPYQKSSYGQQHHGNVSNILLKHYSMYFIHTTPGCEQDWRYLWMVVSSHLFPWPTGSEWHCTFYERPSHHIFSYNQQEVSDIAKCHLSITSFNYDQQPVSNIAHFVKGSLITSFVWPTESEWHCKYCERQSQHVFSYDQQDVSDIAHYVKGNLIKSLPMTTSLWVTLHILQAVSSDLFLCTTASEQHCACEKQVTHQIFPCD